MKEIEEFDSLDVVMYVSGMALWILILYATFFVHNDYMIIADTVDILNQKYSKESCEDVKKTLYGFDLESSCVKVK